MTESTAFKYEELFAGNVPGPQPGGAVVHARYDFAVAYPDPGSLPLEELADSLRDALREEGRDLALYPHRQGYPPLREFVADKLARDRNIDVSPDDIIVADGSSQPIHMIAELFIDPGDVVITDDYVYSGTLGTFRRFGADIRGVRGDDDGMAPDALEATIRGAMAEGKRPKLIYLIPTFQNPQGWTIPLERRQALLRTAGEHGVPILEDDCYVDLRYDGEPVTSIRSLDGSGGVIYVGSFSKIIAPGVRLGYMTGPPEVLARARAIKSGGGVNQLAAFAVHRYATTRLREHVNTINNVLRTKRDAMQAALGENFGSSARWSRPDGALYIWLEMPEGADLLAAQQTAFDSGVGYLPGPNFSPDGVSGRNYARLCFGYNTPEEIRQGIARLSQVFDALGYL